MQVMAPRVKHLARKCSYHAIDSSSPTNPEFLVLNHQECFNRVSTLHFGQTHYIDWDAFQMIDADEEVCKLVSSGG